MAAVGRRTGGALDSDRHLSPNFVADNQSSSYVDPTILAAAR
jgi:hypothetical protein